MTPGGPGGSVHEEWVRLPGRPTRVRVGAGLRRALPEVLARLAPRARRVGWVVDGTVAGLWERPGGLEAPAGLVAVRVVLPPGEAAKERAVLASTQDRLLDLAREEPIVVLGGGAALDLGGLAAATVHRGHPWIAVPTTVLAMADAAVGGKVAINHERGKNLLGTFHPPVEVLADLDLLATLPAREAAAGWAEVWKAGCVGDLRLLEGLLAGPPRDDAARAEALARALAVKARRVEADERDVGPRRALNYGHTVGHALERCVPDLLHGEAVAIGMGVAARLASARGLVPAPWGARQARALTALGLPVDVPAGIEPGRLRALLGMDKKRGPGPTHTFVLPTPDGVIVVDDVGDAELEAALGMPSGPPSRP